MNVCVGLHQRHTAVVRHSHGQRALLCQNPPIDVPAHDSGDDLVFVVPPPGDEEFVVTGGDGAARPLTQARDQRPGV